VTVVVPRKKVVPDAMSEVSETPGQLSAAVGSVQVTAVVQRPASVFWVISAGVPEIVGFWLSVTMTLKVEVTVFPEGSTAV